MEVGCLETRWLELPTLNPHSKNTPQACPTRNPATSLPTTPSSNPSSHHTVPRVGGKKEKKNSEGKTPRSWSTVKLWAHVCNNGACIKMQQKTADSGGAGNCPVTDQCWYSNVVMQTLVATLSIGCPPACQSTPTKHTNNATPTPN